MNCVFHLTSCSPLPHHLHIPGNYCILPHLALLIDRNIIPTVVLLLQLYLQNKCQIHKRKFQVLLAESWQNLLIQDISENDAEDMLMCSTRDLLDSRRIQIQLVIISHNLHQYFSLCLQFLLWVLQTCWLHLLVRYIIR